MGTWTWLVAAVAFGFSLVLSIFGGALGSFHRGRLEDRFTESSRATKLADYLPRIPQYKLSVWTLDAIFDALLVVELVLLNLEYQKALGAFFVPVVLGEAVLLIAVCAEAIPRSWGARNADAVLFRTLGLIDLLAKLVFPMTVMLRVLDSSLARIGGGKRADKDHSHLIVDIMDTARQAEREGVLDEDETEMIESILDVRDGDVADIMTPRTDMIMLPHDATIDDAVKVVADGGPSRIPVFEGTRDQVVGILYARDLLMAQVNDNPEPIKKLMRKPFFVPETKRSFELLREFRANKVHIAIVLDEYGGTAGLVTAEDILEEIVGEIDDEFDKPETAPLQKVDAHTFVADGKVHIDEINEALSIELPEDEDYETIAGYIFAELGKVPSVGETVTHDNVNIEVVDADDRRINRVRLELLQNQTKGS